MCFDAQNIKDLHHWNWDGDVIIHDSVVPSSRWVVGYPETSREYSIDVREFLITDRNEIIKCALQDDLKNYISAIGGDWELFNARREKAFDYKVDIITAWVSEKIKYVAREGTDPWKFPDETLFVKEGDCEDRAFLIASLLLGSGISNFNIRLAMGKVHTEKKTGEKDEYDHMWVMYKDESGRWLVIEPLCTREHTTLAVHDTGTSPEPSRIIARYTPHFLFNDEHLWNIPNSHQGKSFLEHMRLRRNWKKWKPRFAGAVHQTIIQQALISLPVNQHWVIDALNRRFHRAVLGIAGPIVDDIDRDLKTYSPVDHFDNAYIPEGWDNVKNRLVLFSQDNNDLDSFFHAAHGIADFYAHTSWVYFHDITSPDNVPICDPSQPLSFTPAYATDPFNLDSDRFSFNAHYWKNPLQKRSEVWAGKLISGRYAQVSDTQPGLINQLIEGRTNIPAALLAATDFFLRGALPHHNEIAVDDETFDSKKHKLFDAVQYGLQFQARKNCAIRHVKNAFFDNWHPK
jgi:Transglutaminase-like superfamily